MIEPVEKKQVMADSQEYLDKLNAIEIPSSLKDVSDKYKSILKNVIFATRSLTNGENGDIFDDYIKRFL